MKTPLSKENAAVGCLYSFVAIVVITLLIAMFFTSCASTYEVKKRQLCTPNPSYLLIDSCNYDFIYCRDYGKIRNSNHDTLKAGQYLVLKNEFNH